MGDNEGGSAVASPAIAMTAKQFGDFLGIIKEDREKTWEKYQELVSKSMEQEKTRFQVDTETKKGLDKLDQRMDQIELLIQAPRQTGDAAAKSAMMEEFLGPAGYLRKGTVGPSMQKALSTSDSTLGGYLAPNEYVKEIIKQITEHSPIRTIARVSQISGSVAEIPKRTSISTATWLGREAGTDIAETTGLAYGLASIPAHFLVYALPVSMKLVNDSAFNLDAEIRDDCSLAFGVAEGAGFVSGTGVGCPEGFMTKSGITAVNSGNASALTPDGILDLAAALKDGYARNASWVMRRATRYAIRKFKTGTGAYTEPLYVPATRTEPAAIEGRPIVECPDMPAIAGSAYPVAFGDFYQGYRIVDNMNTMFLRDELTLARKMQILYVAAKAVGGQVVNTEAIVKQYVSA
jgi:HK97 family phage major capsid protein